MPREGDKVEALDRSGKPVGVAEVVKVQVYRNKTRVLVLAVPEAIAMEVRHVRQMREGEEP